MEEEWDNLIILDACRYDTFEKVNHLSGELRSVYSKGTDSWEFLEGNFIGKELHDTVYITANPHTERLSEGVFHDVEKLYFDRWDSKHKTVMPSAMTDAAVNAAERYHNKRLIIHYMQPYESYISQLPLDIVEERGFETRGKKLASEDVSSPGLSGISMWQAVQEGYVTNTELQEMYTENLETALDSVDKLLQQLNGRSVITSDHGELLGERMIPSFTPQRRSGNRYDIFKKRYDHTLNMRTQPLCLVPWLEIKSDRRRAITAKQPTTTEEADDDLVRDRLRHLGYLNDEEQQI